MQGATARRALAFCAFMLLPRFFPLAAGCVKAGAIIALRLDRLPGPSLPYLPARNGVGGVQELDDVEGEIVAHPGAGEQLHCERESDRRPGREEPRQHE